jgi:hypothetical protein
MKEDVWVQSNAKNVRAILAMTLAMTKSPVEVIATLVSAIIEYDKIVREPKEDDPPLADLVYDMMKSHTYEDPLEPKGHA